jgi:hypothetical protein
MEGVFDMARHGMKAPAGRLDVVDQELFSDMADEIATLVDVISPLDSDTLLRLSAAHAAVYEKHDSIIDGVISLGICLAVAKRDFRGGGLDG